MAKDLFIGADWGTSTLRLFLCRLDGRGRVTVVAAASGLGVKDVSDFEAVFLKALSELPVDTFQVPAYVAGMAGSTLGWRETAYAQCPVRWRDLAQHSVPVAAGRKHDIRIVPGIACVNRFGVPDFMRGEETQLLGWRFGRDRLVSAKSLVCLPGTHAKWATSTPDGVLRFETSIQGEMFDVLNKHSILTRGAAGSEHRGDAFRRGVMLMRDHESLTLSGALFSVRSLQLSTELNVDDAPSYLSGILVGADVRDIALGSMSDEGVSGPVSLVGEQELCRLYAIAMSEFGVEAIEYDGRQAVVEGLAFIHRELVQDS